MIKTYYRSIATCLECGGSINNHPISSSTREAGEDAWVHQSPDDWVENVHQARPKIGSIRSTGLKVGL